MSFIIRHKTSLFPKQHFSLSEMKPSKRSIRNTQTQSPAPVDEACGGWRERPTARVCQGRNSVGEESGAVACVSIGRTKTICHSHLRHEASVTGPLVRCFFRPQRRLVSGGGPCALRHETGFAMASYTPGRPLNNTNLEVGSPLRPAFLGILL